MTATRLTQRLPPTGLTRHITATRLAQRLPATGVTRHMSAAGLTQRLRAGGVSGPGLSRRLGRVAAAGLTGLARSYATCGSRAYGCGAALGIVGIAIMQLFVFGH
jgi:hypothetical protein